MSTNEAAEGISWLQGLGQRIVALERRLRMGIVTLLLVALYFCVVVPIAIVLRVIGYDPLGLEKRQTLSTWRNIDVRKKPEQHFRQY